MEKKTSSAYKLRTQISAHTESRNTERNWNLHKRLQSELAPLPKMKTSRMIITKALPIRASNQTNIETGSQSARKLGMPSRKLKNFKQTDYAPIEPKDFSFRSGLNMGQSKLDDTLIDILEIISGD